MVRSLQIVNEWVKDSEGIYIIGQENANSIDAGNILAFLVMTFFRGLESYTESVKNNQKDVNVLLQFHYNMKRMTL